MIYGKNGHLMFGLVNLVLWVAVGRFYARSARQRIGAAAVALAWLAYLAYWLWAPGP